MGMSTRIVGARVRAAAGASQGGGSEAARHHVPSIGALTGSN
jgi:hypothetical protein